jgi:methyl-accepting chemotaxis protein
MTVKSVIEIDVLDEKFKAFQASFEKYKKSVDDQSKKWKEVNKTLEEAEKKQKAFNKALQDGAQNLKGAVGYTASIASNMASAAMSAAKWLTYSAIGGGFGLGGLASGASNLRREATGLGVSTSQLRAARTYGEPYLGGIEGVMSNIQRLQTTLTEQYKVGILGGSLGKNSFQNLPDILTKAREAIKASGGNIDVARALTPGLQDVMSEEQLQTVGNMKPDEFAKLISSLKTGANNFAVDEAKYESFRQFWVSLKEAGNIIENSLIKNLDSLTPQLTRLSKTIADAIDNLLSSKEFADAMQTINDGIKEFGKYLASGEAKEDMKTFADALKTLAKVIVATAEFLGLIPDKSLKDQPTGWNWFGEAKNAGFSGKVPASQQGIPIDQSISNKIQGINNSVTLKGVNDKLAASIQMAGLTAVSGVRDKDWAQNNAAYQVNGQWFTKEGRPIAMSGSHHLTGSAVDVSMASLRQFLSKHTENELKEQFNLYRPLGEKDPNHLELFDPNRRDIYITTGDGVSQKAATMAGQQR